MARIILFAVFAIHWAIAHSAAPQPIHSDGAAAVAAVSVEKAPTTPLDCPESIKLVIDFEISSPAYYNARLKKPMCPGGASGPTWCIGYDGGHQISHVILNDWADHPHKTDLATTAGAIGESRCKASVGDLRHVTTELPYCSQVFTTATFPRYWAATVRAFPGIEDMPPCAQGGLFSVVYNRGTAMAGDSRREMREIQNRCVPAKDADCISSEILAMRRLWRGTKLEAGLNRRREAEAAMVIKGDS